VTGSVLLACLSACTGVPPSGAAPPPITATQNLTATPGFRIQTPEFIANPDPSHFSVCHGNTCAKRASVSLSAEEWARVRAVFEPPPRTAAEERLQVGRAVALLEDLVGSRTGTDQDLPKDLGFGRPGQLDCVDEATNTTVYLTLIFNDGLLSWHSVGGRATRGPFTGLLTQWPHSTAVMRDETIDREFAVDAWFLGNGEPPFIVPMSQWWSGWRPQGL
jgi:hypothetical protein